MHGNISLVRSTQLTSLPESTVTALLVDALKTGQNQAVRFDFKVKLCQEWHISILRNMFIYLSRNMPMIVAD